MKVMKQQFKRICSIFCAAMLIVTSVPCMETPVFASQSGMEEIVTVSDGEMETSDGVDDSDLVKEQVSDEESTAVEGQENSGEPVLVEEQVSVEETVSAEEQISAEEPVSVEEQINSEETRTVEVQENGEEASSEGIEEEEVTTPAWNFLFTVKGTTEEQSAVMEQVKVQSIDGTQDLGMSVPINGTEEFSFHVEIPDGYTIISLNAGKAKYFQTTRDYVNNNFSFTPRDEGMISEEGVQIRVVIDKIQDKELYVEYPDSIESVEVLCGDTPVEFVDGTALVANTASTTLKVKPAANQMVTATYESEMDTEPWTYEVASILEDGTYIYEIGRVVYNTNIVLSTDAGAKINIDLGEGISGYINDEDGTSLTDGLVLSKKIGYRTNFYLYIDESMFEGNNFVITNTLADGTEEEIELIFDENMWEYYCSYEVTQDATLSFQWVPKTAYKVTFDIENAQVYQYTYEPDWEEYSQGQECTGETELSIYAGNEIMFGVRCDTDYKIDYVSPTGNAEDALELWAKYNDEYTYYIYRYWPTADTEMKVKASAKEIYEVAFDLENVTAYSVYEDGDYYLGDSLETCNVYEGASIKFVISCENAYRLQYVSTTDSEEGQLEKIGYTYDEGYSVYSYTPTADSIIYAKAAAKEQYTLSFDLNGAYLQGYSFESTEDVLEYELYEGIHTFFLSTDENIKVKSVTVSGNDIPLQKRYDIEERNYYYSVPLTEDITVSVNTVAKEQYGVQINSENISVTNVTGDIDSTDDLITVYEGGTLSFKATPDEGYEIENASVSGNQTLYPQKSGNTNTYEVKVDRDIEIDITTAVKTAYAVSFETANATVASDNPMDESGNYIAYVGEPFIFTVEAEEGYIIDSVTADEELKAVYDPYSSTCHYELTAESDTVITVVSKEAASNQLTFTYEGNDPDTISVWSESGQTYTPSNGIITVSSNEIIWFDVAEDASTVAGVVCTDSAGEEKTIYRTKYSSKTGYCIGNVTEDMQVAVNSGATYEVALYSLSSHEKFVPVDGGGVFPESVYAPAGENFDFKVVTEQDYDLQSVKLSYGGGKAGLTGSLDTGIYQITPSITGYTSYAKVLTYSSRLINTECLFDYPEEEVSVEVYVGDEQVPLVNDAAVFPSTESVTLKVKPLVDKIIKLSTGGKPESIEEDGTYVYIIDDIIYHDCIYIYTYDYHTIDFQMENVSLIVGEYNNDDEAWTWEEAEAPFKIAKGSKLDFRLNVDDEYLFSDISVEDETTGTIKKVSYYDWEIDGYYQYYSLTPSDDAIVNVSVEPVTYNTYNFEYDSSKVDLYMGVFSYYDEESYEVEWVEGSAEYKRPTFNTQNVCFRVVPKEGYIISSVKSDREDSGISSGYDWNCEVSYYYLTNTEDTIISIQTEDIKSYPFTFEYGEGIEQIAIYAPEEGNTTYIGGEEGGESATLSNQYGYYIIPSLYYNDDGETSSYKITSVTANGEVLTFHNYDEDYGYGYWLPAGFTEAVSIVIETVINEAYVNTTSFAVDGDADSYKIFRYVESENDEGELVTSKVYLDSDDKLYTKGRTDRVGFELEEGYELSKVEFVRNGKLQVLSADEDGLYNIYYPLSRGLKGTVTVYIVVEPVEETYEAVPLHMANADGTTAEMTAENGIYSVESGMNYVAAVLQESVSGNAILTKAEITAESAAKTTEAVSTVTISETDATQAKITIAKEDEGKTLFVNLYVEETQKLVATYILYVNESDLVKSVTVEGIADGKVSQAIDSVKTYKLTAAPAEADVTRIGVEVELAEGQAEGNVRAEIIEGNLQITTAATTAGENVATIKLYDSGAKGKTYIQGGTFTVSTLSPTALVNGAVQAEVLGCYDVAVNLGLRAPEDLTELLTGKYYYKVVVTPQGEDVPEAIQNATGKPQYFEKGAGDYQEVRVFVNTNDFGGGQAWTYDIAVSLVQTDGAGVPDGTTNAKALYESKAAGLSNISTLNPYFAEKITFDKLEKQVYTAQKDVAVAKIVLAEGTSYPDIEKVEDITQLDGKGSALEVRENSNSIFVTVPSDAKTGKHKIEVTIGGPANMNKTKGTFEINVIKGIESVHVSVPAVNLYKKTNKTASIKATVTYNQETTAPKSKKVTWEVVKANGEAFTQGDALYGMLTVKSGKVTVKKGFVPSETEIDNQFRIKATAADYKANKVSGLSDVITLTSKPAEIGAVYVVAPADGGYQVVVKSGSVITTDKLKNAFVAALKQEAEEKDFYTEEELSDLMLSTELLTYKSSNKAVVVQKADAVTLSATKAVKNVKLTVATNDGGKKNAVMKFTVAYATPEALALEVSKNNQVLGETGAKEVTFAGTTNTRLLVKVKEKSGETWNTLKALSNYKLSVKNGKIVTSDNVNGIYEVIVTAKTATLTLDNKTVGAKAKDVYQITNSAYSEAKAPKVKTKDKLIAGVMAERSVTYALSGNYDYKNKYVLVETDYISRSKKEEIYSQFESSAGNLNTLIPITADGKFTLIFNENQIPAGSYKLKLTFGSGTDAGTFIADAKPATVTLKAVKPKVTKGSYKPVTSYKLEAKAGASAALTGKGKNVVENSLVYYDLKNANIKGIPNKFLSYFELKDNTLSLKNNLTDEDIAYLKSAEGKNNLTGYVSYTVAYGDDGYGNPFTVTKTIKLTIKLK